MNQIKVNQLQTIVSLRQQGWSKRRIARELGLDRKTVRRHLAAQAKSPGDPRTGSESQTSDSPAPQASSDGVVESKSPGNPRTGSLPLGGAGPESLCQPWKEWIEAALNTGLSIQRSYQDLVAEHEFGGSYDSVWRFVRRPAPDGATDATPAAERPASRVRPARVGAGLRSVAAILPEESLFS